MKRVACWSIQYHSALCTDTHTQTGLD